MICERVFELLVAWWWTTWNRLLQEWKGHMRRKVFSTVKKEQHVPQKSIKLNS